MTETVSYEKSFPTVGLGVGVPVSILVGILIVGVVIAATVLFQRHKQNEKR